MYPREEEMLAAGVLALDCLREEYTTEAIEGINELNCEEAGQELPPGFFSLGDWATQPPQVQDATKDDRQEDVIPCLHQDFIDLRQQEEKPNPDVVVEFASGCIDADKLEESDALEKELPKIRTNPDVELTRGGFNKTMAECRSVIAHQIAEAVILVTNQRKGGEDDKKVFKSFKALSKWMAKRKTGFLRSVWVDLRDLWRKTKKTRRKPEATKSKETDGLGCCSKDAMKGERPTNELFDRLLLAIQLVSFLGNQRLICVRRVLQNHDEVERLHEFIRKYMWEIQKIGSLILELKTA